MWLSFFKVTAMVILSSVVIAVFCSYANARTYYVDKSGNNNNGGSEASPWLTIQKAASMAQAGDVVYIKGGTYIENVTIQNSGTANNYITFTAYPRNSVIIDGTGNAGWWGVISIHGKNYIRIENIDVRNNRIGWGVLIEHAVGNSRVAASYIELTGLTVHDNKDANIEIRGNVNHITVSGGTFFNTNGTGGVDITTWSAGRPKYITLHDNVSHNNKGTPGAGFDSEQADYITAYNNTVYNSSIGFDMGSGLQNAIYGNTVYSCTNGIDISSNSNSVIHDNIIRDIGDEAFYNYYYVSHGEPHIGNKYYNNVVYNAGFGVYESAGKGTTAYQGPTSNHQYFNNLFYNIGTHGSYRTSFYFQSTTELKFVNNTIYMNDSYPALQLSSGSSAIGCSGATIENNIFDLSGSVASVTVDMYSQSGLTLDYNNCFYRSGSGSCSGTHSVSGNPMFSNVTTGDFQITPGSAAIDMGTSLSSIITTDRIGRTRPQGLTWDIGAYEYPRGGKLPAVRKDSI